MIKITIDDGCEQDMRIATMLERHGLKGLFYINSKLLGEVDRTPHPRRGYLLLKHEVIELSKKHEIGGHTLTHPMDIKLLTKEQKWKEIDEDKKALESLIGKEVSSYCHPRGRFDEETIKLIKKASYKDARSVNLGFGGHLYAQECFQLANRKEYGGVDWFDYVTEKVKEAQKKEIDMIVFLHAWEVDANGDWEKVDRFFKFIKDTI